MAGISEPVAETYLAALDAGDIDSMWKQLDPAARGFTFESRTKFANLSSCRQESVVLRAAQDKLWHVFVNDISTTDIAC
jgi:hypothetical protein